MIAEISIIILLVIAFGISFLVIRHHYTNLLKVATKRAQKSDQGRTWSAKEFRGVCFHSFHQS